MTHPTITAGPCAYVCFAETGNCIIWSTNEEHVATAAAAHGRPYIPLLGPTAIEVQLSPLLEALRFYSAGEHYHLDPAGEKFDDVSGEPPNWLCAENSCTMLEDGTVAAQALQAWAKATGATEDLARLPTLQALDLDILADIHHAHGNALLANGCNSETATQMQASLQDLAARIRAETARRGKPGFPELFPQDQTAVTHPTVKDQAITNEAPAPLDYAGDGACAYVCFAANGNCIIWSTDQQQVADAAAKYGLPYIPLYGPKAGEVASLAASDVLAERARQITAEGWTHDHDDEHVNDELAAMACYYAMPPGARDWPAAETGYGSTWGEAIRPENWNFQSGDRRRELVKAAALALAEIERLDRAAEAEKGGT